MNKAKFKKYLKKLKQYDKLLDKSKEPLSPLERDLILDYIRKMYEAVLADNNYEEKHPKHKIKHIKNKQDKKVPPQVETPSPVEDILKDEAEMDTAGETVQAPEVKQANVEPPIEENTAVDFSPEFLSIFEDKKGHDLSDKLSMLPIADLKKAFSINERIFTVNELFGGDESEFENALTVLNSLSGFEDAKQFLLKEIAPKYDWDNGKKIKKAANFIKIVKRRYL